MEEQLQLPHPYQLVAQVELADRLIWAELALAADPTQLLEETQPQTQARAAVALALAEELRLLVDQAVAPAAMLMLLLALPRLLTLMPLELAVQEEQLEHQAQPAVTEQTVLLL